MVSFHSANRALEVNMLPSPALVTLPSKGAIGFNIIILPTVLAGAFKMFE